MSSDWLSFRETLKQTRDFLQVAFHSILYLRHVYPEQLFAKKQKYGVFVWGSRSPVLNDYIIQMLDSIMEELRKGALQKVVFVIKSTTVDETPIERFIFDFEWLMDRAELAHDEDWLPEANGVTQSEINDIFRGVLTKIQYAAAKYGEQSEEVSFTVVLEMYDGADPPESTAARKKLIPAEWVPAEERATTEADPVSRLVPLKTARMGMLNMQFMAVELEAKRPGDITSSGESHAPAIDLKGKGKAM